MVQQLSNPAALVPSSMQSGGVLGDDKGPREMTAPGSAPVTGPPTAETVSPQRLPEPVSSAAGTDREVLDPGASVATPQVPARDRGTGQFIAAGSTAKGADGMWRLTTGGR